MVFNTCPKCGRMASENEEICLDCGASLSSEPVSETKLEFDDSHIDGPRVFFARGQAALTKTSYQIMLMNGRLSLFDSGNVDVLGALDDLDEIVETPYGATTFRFKNGEVIRFFSDTVGGALNDFCRSVQVVSGRMLIKSASDALPESEATDEQPAHKTQTGRSIHPMGQTQPGRRMMPQTAALTQDSGQTGPVTVRLESDSLKVQLVQDTSMKTLAGKFVNSTITVFFIVGFFYIFAYAEYFMYGSALALILTALYVITARLRSRKINWTMVAALGMTMGLYLAVSAYIFDLQAGERAQWKATYYEINHLIDADQCDVAFQKLYFVQRMNGAETLNKKLAEKIRGKVQVLMHDPSEQNIERARNLMEMAELDPEIHKEIILLIDSSNLERQYSEARQLIEQGNVEGAKELLTVLGDYKDSQQMLARMNDPAFREEMKRRERESNYSQVMALMEQNKFREARSVLDRLDESYMDCRELKVKCDEAIEAGRYEEISAEIEKDIASVSRMLEYGENEEARFLLDKCRSSINAMKELKPAEKNIITPLLERLQKLEEQYQNSLDDLEAEQNYDKIRGPQPLPGRRGNYPCVEKELLKVTSSRKNLQIIEWEKVYPERDHWSVVVKYMEGRGKSRKKSRMKVDFQTRDGVTCYLIKTSDLY